jgi:hypothetical protein
MSLSQIFRLISHAARIAVVAVLLVALGAAGADAARRYDAESKKKVEATVTIVTDSPQVGPSPAPERPGGNMAPTSRPTTEQQCVLGAVTAPSGNDRTGDRLNNHSLLKTDIAFLIGAKNSATPVVSLAQVAPQSARILTLVGAVPSGTM